MNRGKHPENRRELHLRLPAFAYFFDSNILKPGEE